MAASSETDTDNEGGVIVRLGPVQQAAVAIYVTDPAHEQTACWIEDGRLVIADLKAARQAVNDGSDSAFEDGDSEMVRALVGLYLRLCKM